MTRLLGLLFPAIAVQIQESRSRLRDPQKFHAQKASQRVSATSHRVFSTPTTRKYASRGAPRVYTSITSLLQANSLTRSRVSPMAT